MKTIVISGNYNQGLKWAEADAKKRWDAGETSISISNYIIVSIVEQIRGIRNPHGVFVGTWKERENIKEIVLSLIAQSEVANENLRAIWKSL
jgi:hypothetical protein